MQQPSPLNKSKALFYDRLHRFGLYTVFGVSAVATGLLLYNLYLFKTGITHLDGIISKLSVKSYRIHTSSDSSRQVDFKYVSLFTI